MKKYIIEDYADIISVREANPANSKFERFVGLEHYIPGDVVIKKYGPTDNLASAAKVFRKGDILVARRNVYLHRASVVNFDGITSGDTIVLRPKDDTAARFLPFVLNTESFWTYAEKYADGTMSKRLSPDILKKYAFNLPDESERDYYSEALWQTEKTIQAEERALDSAISLRNSFYAMTQSEEFFEENGYEYSVGKVGESYKVCNNLRKPISQAERSKIQGSYPYWGPTGILDYISEYRLDGEYVLLGEDGDHFLKYLDWDMTHLVKGKFNVNNHAHVLAQEGENILKWLYYYFIHRNIEDVLTKQGGGRLKLTKGTLMDLSILLPLPEVQLELCNKYDAMEKNIADLKSKIQATKKIQKDLSEYCLSGKESL
ncbi:MAG: restriction endonuclease subunit S [Dorea sp.]|nr:restriction endonuclease subunit S [Dorea sp.]